MAGIRLFNTRRRCERGAGVGDPTFNFCLSLAGVERPEPIGMATRRLRISEVDWAIVFAARAPGQHPAQREAPPFPPVLETPTIAGGRSCGADPPNFAAACAVSDGGVPASVSRARGSSMRTAPATGRRN